MRIYLIIVTVLFAQIVNAQYSITLQSGIGQGLFHVPRPSYVDPDNYVKKSAYPMPLISLQYRNENDDRFNFGISLRLQRYSFLYESSHGGLGAQEINNVDHISSFIFAGPVFSWCLADRQSVVFNFIPDVGIFAGGFENIEKGTNSSYGLNPTYPDSYQRSSEISRYILSLNAQLQERIHIGRSWRIIITESYGVMIGSITKSAQVEPGYVSLQLGIMHKYKARQYAED